MATPGELIEVKLGTNTPIGGSSPVKKKKPKDPTLLEGSGSGGAADRNDISNAPMTGVSKTLGDFAKSAISMAPGGMTGGVGTMVSLAGYATGAIDQPENYNANPAYGAAYSKHLARLRKAYPGMNAMSLSKMAEMSAGKDMADMENAQSAKAPASEMGAAKSAMKAAMDKTKDKSAKSKSKPDGSRFGGDF